MSNYIRKAYMVPAKRGGRVEHTGCGKPERGTITSADGGQLRITWERSYLPADDADVGSLTAM